MAEQGLIDRAPSVDREAFLAEIRTAAERAADATGGFDRRDFAIAGRRVSLLFAGEPLIEPLTAALEHARIDPQGDAALTVLIWDEASSGVAMPAPRWGPDDYREHGVIRGWFDDDLQIVFQWITNSVSVLEPRRGAGAFWLADPAIFPFFDRAAPLRKMLHLWFASQGLQLTHAAALTGPAGAVLIAGNAGAGKSSATLACLPSTDLGHLADDYCVIEPTGGGGPPRVHALYSSAKANPDTMERLGIDPGWVANPIRQEGDKAVFFLHRHLPGKLVEGARLTAIAVPVITGERDTRLVPAGAGAALAALAPSTMLQLPRTGPATLAILREAADSVPCYRLEVGTDPEQVPRRLSELLAG